MHWRKGWKNFPCVVNVISLSTAKGTVASGVHRALLQPPLPRWVLLGFAGRGQDLASHVQVTSGPWDLLAVKDICTSVQAWWGPQGRLKPISMAAGGLDGASNERNPNLLLVKKVNCPGLWQWRSTTREPQTPMLFEIYMFYKNFIPTFSVERNLLLMRCPRAFGGAARPPSLWDSACAAAPGCDAQLCVSDIFTTWTSPQFNLTFSI